MTVTLTEQEIMAKVERMEARLQADLEVERLARRQGLTLARVHEPEHESIPFHAAPLGSDPTLAETEAVCETSRLTYNRWMPCPHHYDGSPSCSAV